MQYIFILYFLPMTILTYFGLNWLEKYNAAKLSIVIASLVFYGYSDISFVYILVSSILTDYLVCSLLRRFPKQSVMFMTIGIIANIAVLGYFKYSSFLLERINTLTGGDFDYLDVVLPLGISYFTFQQISYLIEVRKRSLLQLQFLDYVRSVQKRPPGPFLPGANAIYCDEIELIVYLLKSPS